jgi:hypothetical protein
MDSEQRPAEFGDLCTCGRQAVVVYISEEYGEVGHCGVEGSAAQPILPCPFCHSSKPHKASWGDPAKCPDYRLRPVRPSDPVTTQASVERIRRVVRDRQIPGIAGHRLAGILSWWQLPTSLEYALIAEATSVTVPWLLNGHDEAVVAYRSRDGRQLRCLAHAPDESLIGVDWFARTEDQVDGDANRCTTAGCGVDVLAPPDTERPTAHGMTLGELRAELEKLKHLPDATLVVLAASPEGVHYSPISVVTEGLYEGDANVGQFYLPEDLRMSEDDPGEFPEAPATAQTAVGIFPRG